jgi:response regulator RpfG family c-di-GMP phosphodiesterase
MWSKKPPKATFIDNCFKTIVTINRILTEGNYFEQAVSEEQKVKVSIEEETDTVLLEIKLRENLGTAFISNLKNNSLTKHIPILMVTKLNTQFFWDHLNLSGNCFSNIKPGKNPWILVKINSLD